MSYNGSGTFQINTSGQPVVAGTVISATAFNALTADLATGLSTAITKDGQTTTTARIPFAAGISSTLTTDSSSVSTGSIITAGGVGVAKNLYVGVNANVAGTLGVTGVSTFAAGTAAAPAITTTGDTNTGIFFPAADTIAFSEGGTEAMRLDSAGNMGLGVTPSAWASRTVLEVGAAGNAFVSGGAGDVYVTEGCYYNAGWKYGNSLYATALYNQYRGTHSWSTAASGTAGNAITFTQAMTLDASGRLGITETSPAYKVDVKVSTAGSIVDLLRLNNGGGSNGGGAGLVFEDAGARAKVAGVVFGANENSGLGLGFYTSTNAGGSVTERARIDSSGNLLVRCTSSGFGNDNGTSIESEAVVQRHINGTASGSAYTYFIYNSSNIGTIIQNGTTGVLYQITSDYRLKNNQQVLTGAKDFIMALKPKKWQWWDGSGEGVGFVAHEFMEVAKYSGNGEKDAVGADGKPVYQSIQPSSSEVMANLVAFIQEQQTLITQLQADVAALKGTA